MILDKIKNRGEEMAPLEGHDRLQYHIDIAREVPPLEDKDKIDENKINDFIIFCQRESRECYSYIYTNQRYS